MSLPSPAETVESSPRTALRRYFLNIAIWSVCVLPVTLAVMWVMAAVLWIVFTLAGNGNGASLGSQSDLDGFLFFCKTIIGGLAAIGWFLVLIRIYRRGRDLVRAAEPQRKWKARGIGWGGVLLCSVMAKVYAGAAFLILWLLVMKGGRL